jgi:DNA replication protein DnaC
LNEEICSACHGTGWVLDKTPEGERARRCDCFNRRRLEALREQARVPQRYRNCSLDNFKSLNDSHRDALKISRKFVDNFPAQDIGLLYIGPCGVGKTHLAVAVIQEIIRTKGVPCLFYDFRELIRDIQNSHTPEAQLSESDILSPVFSSEVLVLDELGARRTSSWVEETVFYIINHRYNHKKLSLFTSNYLDTEEEADLRNPYFKKEEETLVDRIGVRLRSRIYEMCKVVEMAGDDFRKVVKQGGYRF